MEIEELCSNNLLGELEDPTNLDSILHQMRNLIVSQSQNIYSVRCAAHTFQLAVMSALKVDEFKNIISLCRVVCKELRKHSKTIELKEKGIHCKIPRIDVNTRWNSTYLMVRVFIEYFFYFPITLVSKSTSIPKIERKFIEPSRKRNQRVKLPQKMFSNRRRILTGDHCDSDRTNFTLIVLFIPLRSLFLFFQSCWI